jgi:hypothetical protein
MGTKMMSPNSEQTANSSNRSTETTRTDATTRETHLARLDSLVKMFVEARGETYRVQFTEDGSDNCAASLRWLIERERARS